MRQALSTQPWLSLNSEIPLPLPPSAGAKCTTTPGWGITSLSLKKLHFIQALLILLKQKQKQNKNKKTQQNPKQKNPPNLEEDNGKSKSG